jgi:hypothetical protein
MALEDTPSIISYAGNDSTVTAYPLPFVFFSDDDIALYVDGVLSADTFSIIGDKFAGTASAVTDVAYTSSPEQTVTFQREVSYDQPTVLPGSGRTDPTTLERSYDYLAMQTQQLDENVSRAITAAPGATPAGGYVSQLADTTLGQDSNGNWISRTVAQEVEFLGIAEDVAIVTASAADAVASKAAAEASKAAAEAAAIEAAARLDDLPAALSATNVFTVTPATDISAWSINVGGLISAASTSGSWNQNEVATEIAEALNLGPFVSASASGNVVTVTARVTGDAGNGIACSEITSIGTWSFPSTTGGSSIDASNVEVNVKAAAFGAIGDGVTDDTAAIQLAIVAGKAQGRAIYFPAGNYKVSGTFVLDWEGATVVGQSCGLTGSLITTTSTTLPVFSVPGDYNNVQLCNLRIIGPGRATSTSYGVYMRGDLEGGSNIDFATIDKVVCVGFASGLYAKGFANSSVYNLGTTDCTKGVELLGNSNSVTFENCACVCTDGSATGTHGMNIASSCNGVLISSCDFGAGALEWCIWDEGISTTVIGGQWEAYHSGIYSIYGLNMSGVYVRDFGSPSTSRYSVRTDMATITSCRLSVKTSGTGAALRIDSTATRLVFVTGSDEMLADYFSTAGVFDSTGPVLNIPTNIGNSGETASASNHGAWWRRSATAIDDSWSVVVKDSGDNYEIANLFAYHFDVQNNGVPAYIDGNNTFTGSTTRITRAINPGLSVTTGTYTTAQSSAGLFIVTGAGSVATNTIVGETIVLAKTGNDMVFATGSDSTNQAVRARINKDGIKTYANDAAADADSRLRSLSFYKLTGDRAIYQKP